MPTRIYVGGLSFATSSEALGALFAEVGGVDSAALVLDTTTGQSRGFGYVQMASAEAAASAVKRLHRKDVDGRKLVVHLAP